jgi:hypothetical protein
MCPFRRCGGISQPSVRGVVFDEPNLLAAAGLVPGGGVGRRRVGLLELVDQFVSVPTDKAEQRVEGHLGRHRADGSLEFHADHVMRARRARRMVTRTAPNGWA